MLTVEEAEIRVAELKDEAAKLTAALQQLEQERADHSKKAEAAFVASERTPTPQSQREASQLEAHGNLLTSQVRRKCVGLDAVNADLVVAQDNVQRAKRAATVGTLEGYYAALEGLAVRLDKDMRDYDAWAEMYGLLRRGNALYSTVKPTDVPYQRTIFIDGAAVYDRVLADFRIRLDKALNPLVERGVTSQFATLAAAMDLPRLQRELAHLRRLHVDSLEAVLA